MSAGIWLVIAIIGFIVFLVGWLLSNNREPRTGRPLQLIGAIVAIVGLIGLLVVQLQ